MFRKAGKRLGEELGEWVLGFIHIWYVKMNRATESDDQLRTYDIICIDNTQEQILSDNAGLYKIRARSGENEELLTKLDTFHDTAVVAVDRQLQ